MEGHQAILTVEQRLYHSLGAGTNLPQEALTILDMLVAGTQEALRKNLVGVYLRGSIVMGDFDPTTSDIDFFTVTKDPVSDVEFAALNALHERLWTLANRYGDQLEGPYIDRLAARRFQPGHKHPTIARGEP